MIDDPSLTAHDQSRYERPTLPYRCGRGALWLKPCAAGAGVDGDCGGTSECRPFRKGDRWECRRPKQNGGTCGDGPLPGGQCSQQHPPCRPQPTLRRWRGRLAMLAALVALAFIGAAFRPGAPPQAVTTTVSAGVISGAHARFTESTGCVACHDAHRPEPMRWLAALGLGSGVKTLTESCLNCHVFAGAPEEARTAAARAPHNRTSWPPATATRAAVATTPTADGAAAVPPLAIAAIPVSGTGSKGPGQVECIACHAEHRGADAQLTRISDAQCNTCHTEKIAAFDRDHPAFPARYPHDQRGQVNFDHAKHFAQYFREASVAAQAPGDCLGCHQVQVDARRVSARNFETSCQGCHAGNVSDRGLVLLNFPQIDEALAPLSEVRAACGLTPDDYAAFAAKFGSAGTATAETIAAPDYGSSVAIDPLEPVPAFLLGATADDQDTYKAPLGALLLAMAKSGAAPLATLIAERVPGAPVDRLLAGLPADLARTVACDWLLNREHAAAAKSDRGWSADGLQLRYKAESHRDPVLGAWADLMLAITADGRAPDADAAALAGNARKAVLDPKAGPGACTKCHGVVATPVPDTVAANRPPHAAATAALGRPAALGIAWAYGVTEPRRHLAYDHVPHLNLLAQGAGCATCHRLDGAADYARGFATLAPLEYVSNFKAIGLETCRTCHKAEAVRQDCGTCHRYHFQPAFVTNMQGSDGAPVASDNAAAAQRPQASEIVR